MLSSQMHSRRQSAVIQNYRSPAANTTAMTTKNLLTIVRARLFASLGLALLTAPVVSPAADRTWSGASGVSANWNDAANWDSLPANGDNLTFTGVAQPMNTNDFAALSAGWLQFANGGFDIYGNALTLSSGITNTAGNNTFNPNLSLAAAQRIESSTASETLTLGGAIANNGNTLTVGGAGNVTWTMNVAQGLKGAGNLIKEGSGTLTLGGGFGNPGFNYGFSGATIVNGGVLQIDGTSWGGYSVVGTSLSINNATVNTTQPHLMSSSGKPLNMNNATLNLGSGSYIGVISMTNSTINGPGEIRGDGNLNVYASATPSTFATAWTLNGNRAAVVEDGAADPDLDFTGLINEQGGARSFTKAGAGKLVLAGACSYTGDTFVNAGTLALAAGAAVLTTPNITVGSGATLDVTAAALSLATGQSLKGNGVVLGDVDATAGIVAPGTSAGTLSLSNTLTLGTGAVLSYELTNNLAVGGGTNDLLVVNNLVVGGSVTVNFSFLSGTPNVGGAYTLIKYQSFSGDVANFTAPPSRYSYTFSDDTVNKAIKVTVTGVPVALTWQGDFGANSWDINVSPNWTNAPATPDYFLNGDNVTFNDSSVNTTVDVQAAVQPGKVTVNSAQDYTLSTTLAGSLEGGGAITKSGAGTLTIAVDNNLGGNGVVTAGTIQVGNGGAVGGLGTGFTTNNSRIVFSRTGTYAYTGTVVGSGGVTISNGTVQLGAGGSTGNILNPITNYATLSVNRTDAPTIPGPIVGTGGVNLAGGASARFNNITTGTGQLNVGNSGAVAATLNVGSGDSIAVNRLYAGEGGGNSGVINQSGGVINVTDSTDTEGPLRLGHWGSATSTYNLTDGQLIITNGANARLSLGIDGVGIWNVNGGSATVNRVDVNGRNAGGGGALNLTNGTIILGPGGLQGNAPYTVNYAGGTLGASANWSSGLTGNLVNASSPLTFDTGTVGTNTVTYSGRLQGPGGLTKIGPGTLALTGANTYTGVTTVSNGTLGAVSLVGPVVVQSGGAISAGSLFTPAVLGITNHLTLNNGAGLNLDLGNTNFPGGVNDLIAVQSNLTLSGSIPVAFNFLGTPYTASAYTLITNIGSQVGSATFYLTNNQTRLTPAFSTTANSVRVQFSGSGANLVWQGDNAANLWNLGTTNWLRGGTPDRYYQADTVTFGDTGSTAPAVNLATTVIPVGATVNSANNYVWSGAGKLSGGATLTKTGTGKLTLATDNDFAGAVNVTGGTLEIGNNGGTGSITTTAVTNNATMTYNRTNAQTFAYNTRGSGVIVKENTNVLSLGTAQALTGGITVNRGTLRWTAGSFGGTMTPTVTINTNGTMLTDATHAPGGGSSLFINRGTWLMNFEDYKQNVSMVDGLIAWGGAGNGGDFRVGLSGGAGNFNLNVSNSVAGSTINMRVNTVVANNNLHINVARGAAANDLTFNHGIYNVGNLHINGNGIVRFNSNNAYSGLTRITGGRLVLGVADCITNTALISVQRPGVLDASAFGLQLGQYRAQTLIGDGGVAGDFADSPTATVLPGTLALAGTTNVTAPGTLTLSNNATLNGATYGFKVFNPAVVGGGVNDLLAINGSLSILGTSTIGLTTNANPQPGTYRVITYSGPAVSPGSFTAATMPFATRYTLGVDDTQPNHVDLVVSGSAANLVWSGDGVGNAWDVTTTPNWNANSEMFYNWDNVTFDDTSLNNNVSVPAPVVPASVAFNNSTRNYNLAGAGKISGPASLTKSGSGSLTLSNRHDYAGATVVNGGVLALALGGGAGTLQNTPVTVNAGGTLHSLVNDSIGFTLGTKLNKLNVNGGTVLHAGTGNLTTWGVDLTMNGGYLVATNSGGLFQFGSAGGVMPPSSFTTLANAQPAIVGRMNLAQPVMTNIVANGTAAEDLLFTNRLTSSSTANTWIKQGAGTLALRTAFDNSSLSLRVDAGDVILGATTANGCANLTLNGGNVKLDGDPNEQIWDSGTVTMLSGTLDMNGKDESINVLAGTGGLIVNNAAGATNILTVGSGNGSSTFGTLFQDGAGRLGFTKAGTGVATITNLNNYSGNTLVGGGTLILSGTASVANSPVVQVNVGTVLNITNLPASKIVIGGGKKLVVSSGSILGSADVNGAFEALTNGLRYPVISGNLTLAAGSTTYLEVDKSSGSATNDQVAVGGTITYGGTLTVTGLGGAYAPGDTFKLFNASSYVGSFSAFNLPVGVVWNTSNLGINGTITVVSVSSPAISAATSLGASGFQLNFSGPAGNTYRVLTQTNPAASTISAMWTPIVTNLFGTSGTATFTDLAATNFPQRYYLISVP